MPRLRRSDTTRPGITRRRSGGGWSYRDADGRVIRDRATREWIAAIAIPPAWTDVWISPVPNGHVLATGVDDAGRRQYRYHEQWRTQKDGVKYDRALELAATLPAARRSVTTDLRAGGLGRERVLATAFRMLDTGSLRVGSERYASEHGSFGLSTLLCAHAETDGDVVRLRFPAKSGQEWDSDIRDPDLVAAVHDLKRRDPHARLLAWRDDAGEWHPLPAEEINADVRARTGGDFTAKDFRTLHGTVAAAVSLAKHGPETSKAARRRALAQAMRDASDVLNNTPTIAKSSYVDPRVVDAYEHGVTIDATRVTAAERELRELFASD